MIQPGFVDARGPEGRAVQGLHVDVRHGSPDEAGSGDDVGSEGADLVRLEPADDLQARREPMIQLGVHRFTWPAALRDDDVGSDAEVDFVPLDVVVQRADRQAVPGSGVHDVRPFEHELMRVSRDHREAGGVERVARIGQVHARVPVPCGFRRESDVSKTPLQRRFPDLAADEVPRRPLRKGRHETEASEVSSDVRARRAIRDHGIRHRTRARRQRIAERRGVVIRRRPVGLRVDLDAGDEAQIAASQHRLARGVEGAGSSGQPGEHKTVSVGFLDDQVHDGRERIRSVQHRARPLDDLDAFEHVDRERLQQIADEPAFENLAGRPSVDEDQDVSAVGLGLISASRDEAPVGEVRAGARQAGHACEDLAEGDAAESLQLVSRDHRDHPRRVGQRLGRFRRRDHLDVEQRLQINRQEIARLVRPGARSAGVVGHGRRGRQAEDEEGAKNAPLMVCHRLSRLSVRG